MAERLRIRSFREPLGKWQKKAAALTALGAPSARRPVRPASSSTPPPAQTSALAAKLDDFLGKRVFVKGLPGGVPP